MQIILGKRGTRDSCERQETRRRDEASEGRQLMTGTAIEDWRTPDSKTEGDGENKCKAGDRAIHSREARDKSVVRASSLLLCTISASLRSRPFTPSSRNYASAAASHPANQLNANHSPHLGFLDMSLRRSSPKMQGVITHSRGHLN